MRRAMQVITTVLFLLALCCSAAMAEVADPDYLRALLDNKVEPGLAYDQIPALNKPRYMPVADAALGMNREEQVFVAKLGSGVFIYPRRIMVYHEIINEEIDGMPFVITHSPLSGALVAYRGRAGNSRTTFGVTGILVNANTVMYDRKTGSLWPQLYGVAIEGPLKGASLTRIPIWWSTWEKASKTYPAARVLSASTGYRRNYNKDPYGSYIRRGTYYTNNSITYPVMRTDNRLPPKERIIGIELDGLHYALPYSRVKRDSVVNFTMGTTPMVAWWDKRLDTVQVFERVLNGKSLTFMDNGDKLLDVATRSEWTFDATATFGVLRGANLDPVPTMNAMWFAWAAFHPNAEIIPRQ